MLTNSSYSYLLKDLAHLASRHIKSYCTSAVVSQLSAVHRGTQFEDRSIALLKQHLSMSLNRVGGKGDGGIDMLGWWWIPTVPEDASSPQPRRRIRVIAQCKAEKKKIGPKYVRELEGVLHRYYSLDVLQEVDDFMSPNRSPNGGPYSTLQVKHVPSVGLLISESPFTKATVLHAQSSSIPLLLLHLPPENDASLTSPSTSNLGSAIWNPMLAGDQGLLGGHMEIRWERSVQGPCRPGLWWRNAKLHSWVPSEA